MNFYPGLPIEGTPLLIVKNTMVLSELTFVQCRFSNTNHEYSKKLKSDLFTITIIDF